MSEFEIKLKPEQEFITLQSVLQVGGIIDTGGMAKAYLAELVKKLNGHSEDDEYI